VIDNEYSWRKDTKKAIDLDSFSQIFFTFAAKLTDYDDSYLYNNRYSGGSGVALPADGPKDGRSQD
jgi:hypothetical protein